MYGDQDMHSVVRNHTMDYMVRIVHVPKALYLMCCTGIIVERWYARECVQCALPHMECNKFLPLLHMSVQVGEGEE